MLSLLKLSFVRNLLIGWFLLFLISVNFSAQYMRNILGLPVILWMGYNVIYGLGHNRRERKKFEAKVYAFCKFSDQSCLHMCHRSAISFDYTSKAIYLMDDDDKIILQPEQIMRWEVGKRPDFVTGSVSTNVGSHVANVHLSSSPGGVSHITFWIRDGAHKVFSVSISSPDFADRFKHFSMTNNIPFV